MNNERKMLPLYLTTYHEVKGRLRVLKSRKFTISSIHLINEPMILNDEWFVFTTKPKTPNSFISIKKEMELANRLMLDTFLVK